LDLEALEVILCFTTPYLAQNEKSYKSATVLEGFKQGFIGQKCEEIPQPTQRGLQHDDNILSDLFLQHQYFALV